MVHLDLLREQAAFADVAILARSYWSRKNSERHFSCFPYDISYSCASGSGAAMDRDWALDIRPPGIATAMFAVPSLAIN